MSKEWRYSLSYHRDGNHIHFERVPFWVVVAEQVLDSPPINWLHWMPGTYKAFSKVIFWLYDKHEEIGKIPATPEALAFLAPDSQWLWDEDYDDPDE